MTDETIPKFINLKTRSLRITCSEELALEIVNPIVAMTAYMLSVSSISEIPDVETLTNSIMSSKTKLATLIANAITRPIDPKTLNTISIEVELTGGYFKIYVRESIYNKENILINQRFNIILKCETNCTLIDKLMFKLKAKYRKLNITKTSKEIAEEACNQFMSIGF